MAGSTKITRLLASAAFIAMVSGSAHAQGMTMPMGGDSKSLTDEEKAKKAEQERAYKSAIGKIPDQKANTDPWGTIRPAGSQTKQNSK
jgi:hypothetical protein